MKKQKPEGFYSLINFIDVVIDNKPEDVLNNEIWLAGNLYSQIKLKQYRGFKIYTSRHLKDNDIIIGKFIIEQN
jgi:hypothetical protein